MPNRILKESICASEEINALTAEQEAFFYRLLVQCDDYGRYDARPPVLRARCYPLRPRITAAKVAGFLARLVEVNLAWLYEVGGRPYLQVTKWDDHQRRRANHSKWPDPDSGQRLTTVDVNGQQPTTDSAEESRNRGVEKRGIENRESRIREVKAAPRAKDGSKKTPTDDQTYLLKKLSNGSDWVPWSLVAKLNGEHGKAAVTTALRYAAETTESPITDPPAFLIAVSKNVAEGKDEW